MCGSASIRQTDLSDRRNRLSSTLWPPVSQQQQPADWGPVEHFIPLQRSHSAAFKHWLTTCTTTPPLHGGSSTHSTSTFPSDRPASTAPVAPPIPLSSSSSSSTPRRVLHLVAHSGGGDHVKVHVELLVDPCHTTATATTSSLRCAVTDLGQRRLLQLGCSGGVLFDERWHAVGLCTNIDCCSAESDSTTAATVELHYLHDVGSELVDELCGRLTLYQPIDGVSNMRFEAMRYRGQGCAMLVQALLPHETELLAESSE